MKISGATLWLVLAASAAVLVQLAIVAGAMLRMSIDDHRLRRLRRRSRALVSLLEDLDAERSPLLRRELARRELARDLATLESWLDVVSEAGHDPAQVQALDYERSGLVARQLAILAHSRRWSQRAAAAAILGWTNSPVAVPALLSCAQDTEGECPAVRQVALRALGRIRDGRAVAPLVEALVHGETWLPPILAGVLVHIGEASVAPLIELLLDRSQPITARKWAARILGDLGERRALSALHLSLDANDAELRSQAATALGRLADERSVDRLLGRLLVDPVPFVRTAVARSLGEIAAERTVHFLVEGLSDPEWWVRLRVVEALEQIGDPARDVLTTALHDRDPQVAREAARALEGQGVVDSALIRLRHAGYEPSTAEFLIDIGRAGNLEPLLEELSSDEPDHIRTMVRILARVENPGAGPALAALLERDLDGNLKARVLDALLRVHDPAHVDVVLNFLEDDDPWVRKAAVDYLGAFADPAVMPRVLPRIRDKEPWTREAALRLAERLQHDGEVPTAVRDCLDDPFPFVRAAAVRVLCAARDFTTLLDEDVTEQLAEASVRQAFLEGMRHRNDLTSLPLLSRLSAFASESDLPRLESLARGVFASLDPRDLIVEVEGRRGDTAQPSERWLAATAIAFAPSNVQLDWLLGFLEDSDPRVRAAAVAGMAESRLTAEEFWSFTSAALADQAPLVVRAGLLAATLRSDPRLRRPVQRCLRHADASVRRDAALAMAFFSNRNVGSALRSVALDRETAPRVAGILARLHLGERDALGDWIDVLGHDELRESLDTMLEEEHRILRRILSMRRAEGEEWISRILACRTAFEAERALLDELERSHDPQLRSFAVDGLERLHTERAHGRVVSALLKDQDPKVRARALRYVVEQDVFDRREHFLRQALQDPVAIVQIQAVHLCICLPDAVATTLLCDHLGTRRREVRAAVSDLLATYLAEDLESAMDLLLGVEATEEFLAGLVETLEKVAVPLSTDLLEMLFEHRWARTRAHALRALVPRLRTGRWPHLARALQDPSPTVRAEAIRVLGPLEFESEEVAGPLHELLERLRVDPSPEVRSRVALLLSAHEVRGRKTWLRELTRDPHARVARCAQRALRSLDDKPAREEIRRIVESLS